MIYSFNSRVRYSEIGTDRKLTLPAAVNYLQDCSTFHSEAIGLGIESPSYQDNIWMLSAWQIVINDYPGLGEEITISTWPYDFSGFYGYRNFTIANEKGEDLIYANSIWVYINLVTGHPAKITEEQRKGYVPEKKYEMHYAPRKIIFSKDMKEQESIPVRRYHIDTNSHMNNAQYIQLGLEYIPEDFSISQMRAEYKKAAVMGDIMYPYVNYEEGKYIVALLDKDKKPFAVMEFSGHVLGRK